MTTGVRHQHDSMTPRATTARDIISRTLSASTAHRNSIALEDSITSTPQRNSTALEDSSTVWRATATHIVAKRWEEHSEMLLSLSR